MQTFFKFLDTPVQYLKGVGPRLADLLAKLPVKNFEDLLYHLPYRYIDFKNLSSLKLAKPGDFVVFKGQLLDFSSSVSARSKKKILSALFQNEREHLEVKFFKIFASQLKQFEKGKWALISGELSVFSGRLQMLHPQIEWLEDESQMPENVEALEAIVPIYPLTEALTNKQLLRMMAVALQHFAEKYKETLPQNLLEKYSLPSLKDTFFHIHQPQQSEELPQLSTYSSSAHKRLIFEEFFYLSLGLAIKKSENTQWIKNEVIQINANEEGLNEFLNQLPFQATGAQLRVLDEIKMDLQNNKQSMSRLVQGDVGCGKTLVALCASLLVLQQGYQVALMAPTELLAEQHFRNITLMLKNYPYSVALLKSAITSSEKKEILQQVSQGKCQLVVGTHALLEEDVKFSNLALAIVDEQHRFGVMQRAQLKSKGRGCHLLVMTATPIPRTLAMTVYGDLDVSVIDELPKGRQPIDTRVYSEKDLPRIYEFVRKIIGQGKQVYFIYPLVDESEKQDLKNATQSAAQLKEIFSEFKVGLVHGQMKSDEKDEVLKQFLQNQIHILVSTTVIEVGIDVPNASLMVVEHAERFGLSQLHQIRGRVGRGSDKSYCFLVASWPRSEVAYKRLDMMSQTNDGFKIAEADLEIRGPGDFMGTRQSGLPDFRIANLVRDLPILEKAKREAEAWLLKDPQLQSEDSLMLKEVLQHRWQGRLGLTEIG